MMKRPVKECKEGEEGKQEQACSLLRKLLLSTVPAVNGPQPALETHSTRSTMAQLCPEPQLMCGRENV